MVQPLDEYLKENRPRSFRDILGHERWFETLVSNLMKERVTHSHQPIALIGRPGVGKMALAKLYAQALVCEQEFAERVDAAPCGVCNECLGIWTSSLAYVENDAGERNDSADVDPEKMQSESLHTLIERDGGLNTASVRVVVFNNAEEFAGFAADIALKTLEEDLASSLYMFVVNDEARFSAALRSRCSVYRVGPISMEDIFGRLSSICNQRSVVFDEGALGSIAVAAAGSFGEALAILARVERHGHVTLRSLHKEPDFAWGPQMLACWGAVLAGRRDEALALFGEVGVDGPGRVRALQAFLVECSIRQAMKQLPVGATVSPALDSIPTESWEFILRQWVEWSERHGLSVDEAIERALGFWATVKTSVPWRASFDRSYEALTDGSGIVASMP
jgi:DNA polymerase III gamma/tau subunit